MERYPSYIKLYEEDKLKDRVDLLYSKLESCDICPHKCGVDRLKDEKGFCKTGEKIYISSFFPHRGEEFPIRGYRGSGTIFLSYCNMRCVYCQNYDISHFGEGKLYSPEELASIMLYLQEEGCHNINWVSPSHVVPQLVRALYIAVKNGLSIPVVYNTSSYDDPDTLKMLEGIVDIYLPDIKYLNEEYGKMYSKVKNYPEIAKKAIMEMYRQVGDLKTDETGIAYRGILVRHLVLPEDISTTKEVVDFLRSVSPNIHLNIIPQYHPYYNAFNYPEISRRLTSDEFLRAFKYAQDSGLNLITD